MPFIPTRAPLPAILVAFAAMAVSLWIACVLGVVIGEISETATEALVMSGGALILLLHMSGVFTTPAPDSLGALLEGASPFCALHDAFLVIGSGGAIGGGPAAAGWAVVLPIIVGLSAPRLTTLSAESA